MKDRMKRLGILLMAVSLCTGTVYAQGETASLAALQENIVMQVNEGTEATSGDSEAPEGSDAVGETQPETAQTVEAESQTAEAESQTPETESQTPETEGQSETGSGSAKTGENGGSQSMEAESETPDSKGQSEISESQGEAGSEEKSEEPETENTKNPILLATSDGTALAKESLAVPESMTLGEETYPVDYMQGIYKVKVPVGTEIIQVTVTDQEEGESLSFAKWGGFFTEMDQHWYLCPDDPVEGSFTQTENVYAVNLANFVLNMEEMTQEQLAVYGELSEEESWAELLVTGENRSELILVEFIDVTESESESETTMEEIAEAEAIHTLSAYDAVAAIADSATVNSTYTKTGNNLLSSTKKYTPTVGSTGGEWEILGLARSGKLDSDTLNKYLNNVVNTLKECNGVLHEKKYTEYSRVILALTSIGVDVTNVGGYNLLKPLSDYDQTVWQGVNGSMWALIAMDSHDYEFPQAASGKTQNSRDKLINNILENEVSGGGWDFNGNSADPDMTGMAIQALAPYYKTNATVQKAVDRGLAKLSSIQKSNGSFATYGSETSESCSQVIVALTALGIDPNTDSRFVKNGKSVVDALLTYANSDGSFRHVLTGGGDQMATEQAYYALTAYERFVGGKTSLYDMSDVAMQSDKEKAEAVKQAINSLPGTIKLTDKSQIEGVKARYDSLSKTQKSLVTNYSKLESAIKKLKELEKKSGSSGSQSGSSSKKLSGSTKSVNLAGSTAGGTVIKKSTADKTGAASKTKESETDKKTTGKTTDKTTDKKGGTKTDKTVTSLVSEINILFKTSVTSQKLPDNAADYTDEQKKQILTIYRDLSKLTEDQKAEVEDSDNYKKYEKAVESFGEASHYDETTGTDVRDNQEDVLPWYVQLGVSSIEIGDDQAKQVSEALKDQGKLLNLSDISLTDLLNDKADWEPEDLVRVSVPLVDLGEYEKVAIAHFKEDGSIEFLEGHIAGNRIEFDTDGFSKFGVVGYNGSMEDLMQTEKTERPLWQYAVPGVGAVALLAVLGGLRLSMSAKEKKKGKQGEDGE